MHHDFLSRCWLFYAVPPEGISTDAVRYVQKIGQPGTVRLTIDRHAASRYTQEDKETIGRIPGYGWEKLNLKVDVTLDDLRERLADRPMWAHALKVIDIIEEAAKGDTHYASDVEQWLTDMTCSTVWLRDVVMEPLRHNPELVEIGKQFNPTTEWHNTWMPLDTTIHCVRNGFKIGE